MHTCRSSLQLYTTTLNVFGNAGNKSVRSQHSRSKARRSYLLSELRSSQSWDVKTSFHATAVFKLYCMHGYFDLSFGKSCGTPSIVLSVTTPSFFTSTVSLPFWTTVVLTTFFPFSYFVVVLTDLKFPRPDEWKDERWSLGIIFKPVWHAFN